MTAGDWVGLGLVYGASCLFPAMREFERQEHRRCQGWSFDQPRVWAAALLWPLWLVQDALLALRDFLRGAMRIGNDYVNRWRS
jgi:hypothetical protein